MAVTWKFTSLDQMSAFMRKEAAELRERANKPSMSKSDAKALMHEAHGWSQAAMIVANSVIEAPEADTRATT